MTSNTTNTTAESSLPVASNSPSITPSSSSTTVNNNVNEITQAPPPLPPSPPPPPSSSSPSSTPSTPTLQLSTSHPSSDIEDDLSKINNPLVDNARSAASISNLINHDVDANSSSSLGSHPTSQISSRSISPDPETPHNTINNEQSLSDNTNITTTKKKRKGDHDNDEDDNLHLDFDPPKRQRRNDPPLTEGNFDDNSTKVSNSALTSPIITGGFDDMMIDDHNSDDYVTSPINPSTSQSSSMGSNVNFAAKQTRKKPYIPRPPNSFILYRQHHHPLILNQHPGINNSEISRIIAEHWRNLSNQEKDEWKRKADEAKQRHMKAWPDYKYQPRRRVVGPTFKKPLKGPDVPSSTTKSDFSAQEGMMDNFVIELSHRKNDPIPRERSRFPGKSVIIIEGGSKELKDRNGNNNSRKLSPTEAINAKLSTSTHQISTFSSHVPQRLPPPCTLVPQLQPLQSSQPPPPPSVAPPSSSSSSSTSTAPASLCGALIVFEGCEDNTSLQSKKLYDFLKNEGIKAKLWKFPDTSTPSGNALEIYQSTNRQPHPKALHFLVAAHWWELMPSMKELLMNGVTLIVDRYVYSSMAESVAAGLELHWCKSSYTQVLTPDLTFFLNVEREAIEIDKQLSSQLSQLSLPHVNDVLKIGNNDSDDGRIKDWQRRVQDALSRFADPQWKILDVHKSKPIINAQIITASVEVIERCRKSTNYSNMFMPHQNQQLPPLGTSSSQQSQYPSTGSPPSSHQQQNSNVLPPIGGRHDFSRSVHVQL